VRKAFESILGADHAVIGGHRIDGVPVLPGLAYIDMLYQLAVATLGIEPRHYALHRLMIFRPLAIADAGQRVRFVFDGDASGWDITVESFDGGESSRYATARLLPMTVEPPAPLDLARLIEEATRQTSLEMIYAASEQRGLMHRGLIRAHGDIFLGPSGCLARLHAPDGSEASLLAFHPALIDGAAMASEALRSIDDPILFLPLCYDSFVPFGKLGRDCHAFMDAASVQSTGDIHRMDISFYDEHGAPLAMLRGMTSKRVRADSLWDGAATNEVRASASRSRDESAAQGDTVHVLIRILAAATNLSPEAIDPEAGFFDLGLQSSRMLALVEDIERAFSASFAPTLLFEHGSTRELAAFIDSVSRTHAKKPAATAAIAATRRTYVFDTRDTLLDHHRVRGVPMLPGVVHPSLLLDMALAAGSTWPLVLNDVVFAGGPLQGDQQGRLAVEVQLDRATGRFATFHAGAAEASCRGRISTADQPAIGETFPSLPGDMRRLDELEREAMFCAVADFQLGPALRTLDDIHVSQGTHPRLVATVRRSSQTTHSSDALLDPAGLVACYFPPYPDGDDDVAWVPLAIERVVLNRPWQEAVRVIHTRRMKRDGFQSFDATLLDATGACVAVLQNASMHVLPRDVSRPAAVPQRTAPAAQNGENSALDVAIIGMAGSYPGANDLHAFWANLVAGVDSIREIPPERWDWRGYAANSERSESGRWGGFIDGVDLFAPLFFGISPREAAGMDPQERLFLEQCWLGIEHAGYTPSSLGCAERDEARRIGVYAGVMSQEYALFAAQASMDGVPFGLPTGTGSIANRISHHFDFRGPSLAVDTMCSSSLTAIVMACEALRDGRIDAALAGGVNVSLHPNKYLMLAAGGFLSSHGRCMSFGADGDGYVPGEGVGVLVLKRLEDAVRDGDDIHGVVRGAAINHGGRSSGYTVPNPRAQAEVVARAWRQSRVDVARLRYIEAHGTGTSLGDPIEIAGLVRGLGERVASCVIGSVKSNIGHTESAAGVASVSKVLMQMRHGRIAPSLHADVLNPNINFDDVAFQVPRELMDWPAAASGQGRVAAVSSFGAGGSNAHVVIEEYVHTETAVPVMETAQVFPLSARSDAELTGRIRQLLAWLDAGPIDAATFARVAYTLQVGRVAMAHRVAVVARSAEALASTCRDLLAGRQPTVAVFNAVLHPLDKAVDVPAANASKERLAQAWVHGAGIEWTAIHPQRLPRRIELPGYPFTRERCWIGAWEASAVLAPKPVATSPVDHAYPISVLAGAWIPAAPMPPSNIRSAGAIVCLLSDPAAQQELAPALAAITSGPVIFVAAVAGAKGEWQPSKHGTMLVIDPSHASSQRDLAAALVKVAGDAPLHAWIDLWSLERGAGPELALTLATTGWLVGSGIVCERLLVMAGCVAAQADSRQRAAALLAIGPALRATLPATSLGTSLLDIAGDRVDWKDCAHVLSVELAAPSISGSRWTDGVRHVHTMTPLDMSQVPAPLPYRQNGTYLVTGGLGGLGLLIATHLVNEVAANLVLVGRSALDAHRQRILDGLQRAANKVVYIQADAAVSGALRSALQRAGVPLSSMDGIFHAAGVADKKGLGEKSLDAISATLVPKIDGAVMLDDIAEEAGADFLCYFSSSSALLGDMGRGDYAVANRYLLAHAQAASARGSRVRHVAIAWPWWRGGGMARDDAEATEFHLRTSRQRGIEDEEGLLLMAQLLWLGHAAPLVVAADPARIHHLLGMATVSAPPASMQSMPASTWSSVSLGDALRKIASTILHLPPSRLDVDENLASFGFDSMTLRAFARSIETELQIEVSPTVFFNHPTLARLTAHLLAQAPAQRSAALPQAHAEADEDAIAIIGISGRFPSARDVGSMWSFLAEARNAITEISPERFDWKAFYDAAADADTHDATISRWTGTVPGALEFEPLFFGISPREACDIDPRQRLLLQESYRALEDAACGPRQLAQRHVGVFVGVEPSGYGGVQRDAQSITANHDAMLAARLAHFLDLGGPNMAINTACSSGLVALHQACMHLRAGECDTALVGSANLMFSPASYIGMTRAGMLSPDGRCHVFDERANGMVPGEAVVALVLRKVSQARRDGDPIHGVILASAINHDGRSNGITAPNGVAQERLLDAAYDKYGVDAGMIEHVIAHGTGTPLGDPVEIDALRAVFRRRTARSEYCALTSTKATFGHCFAASGLVSVVAMIQSFAHEAIPASLHFEQPNRFADWKDSPFFVNTRLRPWPRKASGYRLGAVSAFGMSGTNAHVVLRDESVSRPSFTDPHQPRLFVLSARTEEALREYAQLLRKVLAEAEESLDDVAWTLADGRRHQGMRYAFVACSREQAVARLAECVAGHCAVIEPSGDVAQHQLEAIGAAFAHGGELDIAVAFAGVHARRIHLPGYPFARTEYVAEQLAAVPLVRGPEPAHAAAKIGGSGRDLIAALVCEQLGIARDQLPDEAPLDQYGLDSIGAAALVSRLRKIMPNLSATLFLEHPTLGGLLNHLDARYAALLSAQAARAELPLGASPPHVVASVPRAHERVSVIGLAGRFPGADTIEAFWTQLMRGQPVTTPMPARRRTLLGMAPETDVQAPAYHGGYLDDVEYFDHELFKVSHRDACAMDPQLRMLAEIAWCAIAEAGYTLSEFRQRPTGVYVATGGPSGYHELAQAGVDSAALPGSGGLYAGRLSNLLDLKGVSESIDTGCSSLLVAITRAVADLRLGRCDKALVATVQLNLSPAAYAATAAHPLYSHGDTTRSFARDADGYVRSEIIGALVLKREDVALRDGDHVLCHIAGGGVAHGGKAPLKWYSPNIEGQKAAITEALADACVDPGSIDYVEAEANGSQLGDASEMVALHAIYAAHPSARQQPLAVSSLKPVFGHAEAGATFPALVKVIWGLRECIIPAVDGLGELNGGIPVSTAIEILRTPRAWLRRHAADGSVQRRRAAVHSLALAGVNAHLIVEESLPVVSPAETPGTRHVFVFSARTPLLLKATVSTYIDLLLSSPGSIGGNCLAEAAATLQTGRPSERYRLAVIADSADELRKRLDGWYGGTAKLEGVFAGSSDQGGSDVVAGGLSMQGDGDRQEAIAAAWAKGGTVSWPVLAPGYRRARLPAGALARRYCWQADVEATDVFPDAGLGTHTLTPRWVPSTPVMRPSSRLITRLYCGWPAEMTEGLPRSDECVRNMAIVAPSDDMADAFAHYAKQVMHETAVIARSGNAAQLLQVVLPNGLDHLGLLGLAGLLRCARKEVSTLRAQVIVADHSFTADHVTAALELAVAHDEQVLLQHFDGRFWKPLWQPCGEASAATASPAFARTCPTVIVTGGVGHIGMAIAAELLRRHPGATVWLAGRSPLDASRADELARLDGVRYVALDVSDRAAVDRVVAEAVAATGRLDGVIHCAGSLHDRRLIDLTDNDIDAAFRAKVHGTKNLDEATCELELEVFATCSSITAMTGNAGQAAYAAANAFMDAYIARRQQLAIFGRRHGRSVSINWPLWADGGMRMPAAIVEGLQLEYGMLPMPTADGVAAAFAALRSDESQVAVVYGKFEKLRKTVRSLQ
jgi:acyl transferase domain-containing protein/acyl carrier protein